MESNGSGVASYQWLEKVVAADASLEQARRHLFEVKNLGRKYTDMDHPAYVDCDAVSFALTKYGIGCRIDTLNAHLGFLKEELRTVQRESADVNALQKKIDAVSTVIEFTDRQVSALVAFAEHKTEAKAT